MAVHYLVRYEEKETRGFGGSDEKLRTKDSESEALNFVVDAMKGEDIKVLDIVKADFSYRGVSYTPLEILITKGKFKLAPIPQVEEAK